MAGKGSVNVLWGTAGNSYALGTCRFCGQAFAGDKLETTVTTREHTSIGLYTALAHTQCAAIAVRAGEGADHFPSHPEPHVISDVNPVMGVKLA